MPGIETPTPGIAPRLTEPRHTIAYILSLKGGMPSFNYREIEGIVSRGFKVHIFPTRITDGIYEPKPEWPLHRPSVVKAAVSVLYWMLRRPRTLFSALGEALSDHAMPEFGMACQYSREMRKSGVTLMHCHFADRKMFLTYFCGRLLDVPFTVTVHSHELVFYSGRKLFMRALDASSKIITVCDYNRNYLVNEVHIPQERIETIRLDVPLEDFMPENRLKVLTVAKFYDYKGYDILVSAARLMKEDPVVFWIVGDGPVDVRGMAGDLLASGKIRLLGSLSEEALKVIYQACDVFCLPSKTAPSGQKEGLPVSIMEAMAYSKPVVSTLHAGIPELVDSIVVPENDAKAIAEGIRSYMNDQALRKKDGERNRDKVVRMHGKENVEKLRKIFDSLA